MKNALQLILGFLVISGCHSKNNKTEMLNPDHTFKVIRATDSTSFLQWNNGKTVLRSANPVSNHYLDDKTHLQWSNEKYMCFRHSNGSDTWTDLILPFTNNEVKLYENPLSYDPVNGLVVYETDSLPYKLVAESINFKKKQFIGETWKNCSSVFPHYCIDTIFIENKKLYVDWILPDKTDPSAQKELQQIRLDFP